MPVIPLGKLRTQQDESLEILTRLLTENPSKFDNSEDLKKFARDIKSALSVFLGISRQFIQKLVDIGST
jgi:hypothetical protein